MHDARAASDDGWTADDGAFDHRTLLDHDLALDAAVRIDGAIDAPVERVEDQSIGFEHVLELARVFPPTLNDTWPHREAAIDEVLDGVGDFELVAEARFDAVHRLEDLRTEHVDADQREVADWLLRLFDQAHHLAVLELRDAEHLRIGNARQKDLRRGLLFVEVADELGDSFVEQI